MQVEEIKNKTDWQEENDFGNYEFLQSYDYGDFLIETGKEIKRYGLFENGKMINKFQGSLYKLSLGNSYIYFPRITLKENEIKPFFSYLKDQNITFLRLEPKEDAEEKIKKNGYTTSQTENLQTKYIYLLDVNKKKEELFERFHGKMRYNIRTAEKRGVTISLEKNFKAFWDLIKITADRQNFDLRSEEFSEKFLQLPFVHQITAFYQGKPLAVALTLQYRKKLCYVFGASSEEHRETMAPSLVQWQAIQLAQKLGCEIYDFLGIAPLTKEKADNVSCFNNTCWFNDHPLSGVTRFKSGFSGYGYTYPDATEVVLNAWKYNIYKLSKLIKK